MSNRYFYFTRHGQTIWNVENKICGATDIALTDLGHQQAIDLGSKIAQEDLGISPDARGRYRETHLPDDRHSRKNGAKTEGTELWKI